LLKYLQGDISMENNNQQIVTIADLDLIKQIIDLASSRGAFQGPELSQIGEVYNKLTTFLNLAAAQSQQEQAEQEATQEEATHGSQPPESAVDNSAQGE
jgi:hypothetical protein